MRQETGFLAYFIRVLVHASNPQVVSSTVAGVKNISLIPGTFFIETNHASGNLVHNHKFTKFDVVEEQPAIKFIKIS